MRWTCRHASAEMLTIEVRGDEVVEWFDYHPDDAVRWSFDEVLAGEIDAKVRVLFGDDVLAELHAIVAARSPR